MENRTPKLKLIKGGKSEEPKYSVRTDIVILILSVLFLAVLFYKAA
jgi:hypothetical protein